ncbi:acyltransferase [Desertivirga brevis]|uniref:acyltransferase n=1 Tax=Desertivirga brevis TaxID=2810310 RepID=UPI001A95DF3E|nr:acyltransferase family protein [Pedobacter sp. SYSU D00873]
MERNQSVDTLRTIATLLVLLLHASANYVIQRKAAGVYDSVFWTGNIIDSFCRLAVPIFVMISGRFLLGRSESFAISYKKRAVRVLIPLIVWCLIYLIYRLVFLGNSNLSLPTLFKLIQPFYHLWYLFMILGLYVITPVLNLCIEQISRRSLYYVAFAFLLIGMFLTAYDLKLGNKPFFILWFINYLGYFLLGYLLVGARKVSLFILIIGYLVSSLLIAVLSYYTASRLNHLYFYEYLSPLVVIGALSFYKIFCQLTISKNILSNIAHLTFGVYLTHAGILDLFNRILKSRNLNFLDDPLIGIPVKFVIVLAVSLFVSAAIYKSRMLRKII